MVKIGSRSLQKSGHPEKQVPIKENDLHNPVSLGSSLEARTLKAVYPHFGNTRTSIDHFALENLSEKELKITKTTKEMQAQLHKITKN